MDHLSSDLLRTFMAVAESGSVTGGAARIYRSQSAVSVQIKQLEALVGTPLFQRHGRGVSLSPAGEVLLPVASRVVALLDSALADIKVGGLAGSLRIGIPDDRGRHRLAKLIADFTRTHPKAELMVRCALSTGFPDALAKGTLDLAVHEVETLRPGMLLLHEEPLVWAASRAHDVRARRPLPVALFDRACWWRDLAQKALQRSGHSYRIVYASESVTGVTAAIEAGFAVGLLGASALGDDLEALSAAEGFAALPSSKLVLEFGEKADDKLCRAMAAAIERAFTNNPHSRRGG